MSSGIFRREIMNRIFSYLGFLSIILFFIVPSGTSPAQHRDGKLLRSESWQPFDARSANGDFYVSPQGNDDWSGTLAEPNADNTDGPFASISRAQRAVRELKKEVYQPKGKPIDALYVGSSYPFGKGKDIVVFIREGYYTLNNPLVFGAEDGGERVETNLPSGAFEWHHLRDNYVTYAAYPGEKPVISGALPVKNWKKAGDIWTAEYSGVDISSLIADGKTQILARTPDQGYFTLRQTPASTSEIPYQPGDIKKWADMQDNRIVILLRWRTAYNSIGAVDEEKQIAYLKNPEDGPNGFNGLLVVPPRYYVENVKALLDAPGEWYFDRNKKEILYIPHKNLTDPNKSELSVPKLINLIQIRGEENKPVRNLRFYGLTFEGAKENYRDFPHYYDPSPGSVAIICEYAHNCEFAESELRACEGVGMRINTGCYQTRIFNNRFIGLGQGALGIFGTHDMQNGKLIQLTRETVISNNVFDGCGQGSGGITLHVANTLHTTISHNYFVRSGRPYTLNCGGGGVEGNLSGDYLIEYNHFEDVQHDADDAGVIVVNGMSFNSVVRNNIIHRVHRGFFSDNVAFWFDNMSTDWTVKNNIYYDLEQGDMKLCGTYLTDNDYADNFLIEAPANAPEQFIEGDPEFSCSNLRIFFEEKPVNGALAGGSVVKVMADVYNAGSSGVAPVALYINRKIFETKPFPVIRNNSRTVEFNLRLNDAGEQAIAIGETEPQIVVIQGEEPIIVVDNIQISEERLLLGGSVRVTAEAKNLQSTPIQTNIRLYSNNKELYSQPIELNSNQSKSVSFDIIPEVGNYLIGIENSDVVPLRVMKYKELKIEEQNLHTYISPKSRPAAVEVYQKENKFKIKASGWDFYHAEDAYATVYLKQIKGDFISTVKIVSFQNRTNQWFRAGLFVRNNISESFDVDRGSKGSVLMFSTPGRAGINYDEFGDGCMHKASSENLPEDTPTPIWVRLERHGNRFTGSISLDGHKWMIRRQSKVIPGIKDSIDLGLAAGSSDNVQYYVEMADWKVLVEDGE